MVDAGPEPTYEEKMRVPTDQPTARLVPLVHKVRKKAKIRNRYNQAPHLTRKVTTSQLDITNESQEVSPFPAGDLEPRYLVCSIN